MCVVHLGFKSFVQVLLILLLWPCQDKIVYRFSSPDEKSKKKEKDEKDDEPVKQTSYFALVNMLMNYDELINL